MEFDLSSMVDRRRILAIDASSVPAPPQAAHPGDHLFVNCHYDVAMASHSPLELLQFARDDAQEIVHRLAINERMRNFVSLVVTIYGHFPAPGAQRPARRRIYRMNVLSDDLPTEHALAMPNWFSDLHYEESSELDELTELIHTTTK
jgi:hypothetical protein